MAIQHEFQRDPDDFEFVCIKCGHAFTELDLGAHICGEIVDRRFNHIAIDGDICTECFAAMWEFSAGGIDAAKRRMNLEINLTKQALQGKYVPPTPNKYTTE